MLLLLPLPLPLLLLPSVVVFASSRSDVLSVFVFVFGFGAISVRGFVVRLGQRLYLRYWLLIYCRRCHLLQPSFSVLVSIVVPTVVFVWGRQPLQPLRQLFNRSLIVISVAPITLWLLFGHSGRSFTAAWFSVATLPSVLYAHSDCRVAAFVGSCSFIVISVSSLVHPPTASISLRHHPSRRHCLVTVRLLTGPYFWFRLTSQSSFITFWSILVAIFMVVCRCRLSISDWCAKIVL